jgi:hypothetical protein
MRHALDQAVQTQAPRVAGHRAARVVLQVTAEQAGHDWTQVTMMEAFRPLSDLAERLQQRQRARITQLQSGDALTVDEPRLLDGATRLTG